MNFLGDPEFSKRATMISQLIMLAEPPLDADHLVVKGSLRSDITAPQFVEHLAEWGFPSSCVYLRMMSISDTWL